MIYIATNIFVVGLIGSGKSTLIETLKNERISNGLFSNHSIRFVSYDKICQEEVLSSKIYRKATKKMLGLSEEATINELNTELSSQIIYGKVSLKELDGNISMFTNAKARLREFIYDEKDVVNIIEMSYVSYLDDILDFYGSNYIIEIESYGDTLENIKTRKNSQLHEAIYYQQIKNKNLDFMDSYAIKLELDKHQNYDKRCNEFIKTIDLILNKEIDYFNYENHNWTTNFSLACQIENAIFKKNNHFPIQVYKQKRAVYLRREMCSNFTNLIGFVVNRPYNVAVLAGSYLPFHVGHKDILDQALKDFDKVIIAVGKNEDKKHLYDKYPLPEHIKSNYEVIEYDNMLVSVLDDLAWKYNSKITLVRGLRNNNDFSYEMELRNHINSFTVAEIGFTYYMCSLENVFVSSSMIRKLPSSMQSRYLIGENCAEIDF